MIYTNYLLVCLTFLPNIGQDPLATPPEYISKACSFPSYPPIQIVPSAPMVGADHTIFPVRNLYFNVPSGFIAYKLLSEVPPALSLGDDEHPAKQKEKETLHYK